MTFGSVFGRTFSPTFQPSSQAAASSASTWWDLNGTITSCVAAYQPKGAASLAASYSNLFNPGTNDATVGNAPDWDATDGWKFTGANSDYLILPVFYNSYSIICRYSNATSAAANGVLFGNGLSFYHQPVRAENTRNHVNGVNNSAGIVAGAKTSGIVSIAGPKAYFDGVDLEVTLTTGTLPTNNTYLGRLNYTAPLYMDTAYVQAVAIYNATLTSTQIANLTTAMAAL